MDKLVMCSLPDSTGAESFRILRTSLSRAVEAGQKSLLFISAWGGDGKSMVCANTGAAFAQSGKRTLVIDGDLRRPTISHLFNSRQSAGLANVIQGTAPVAECIRSTAIDLLHVLPSGPMLARPGDFINKTALSQLLTQVHQLFDVIIMDSPPITFFAETSIYATVVDAVVLVVNPRRWKGSEEAKLKRDLDLAGVKIVGVVLNGEDEEAHSGYSYKYNYYHETGGKKRLLKLPKWK